MSYEEEDTSQTEMGSDEVLKIFSCDACDECACACVFEALRPKPYAPRLKPQALRSKHYALSLKP